MTHICDLLTVEKQVCGGSFTHSGTITSPYFPSFYDNRLDECVFLITAEPTQVVQLKFATFKLDSFESKDYVEVKKEKKSIKKLLTSCFKVLSRRRK